MIKCCDEDMLISGDWYHCRKCSNRFIRCLHGEETSVLANMIVEHTAEYDPTWKELQYIFHELWKQGHYEGYEPDVSDKWNTSEWVDKKEGYIHCAECGSSVYSTLALKENKELFCSHKCSAESQRSKKKIKDVNL